MIKTTKLFLAIFAMTSVFVHTTFANQNLSHNELMIQAYVADIKKGMKYKDVWSKVVVTGQIDKDIVKEILDSYGEKPVPIPLVSGNVLTFVDGKDKVVIEPVDFINQRFKINGYEAHFANHQTLNAKLVYANRILQSLKKSASIKHPIQLLIFPHVAEALPLIPIGLVIVNGVAWGSVGKSAYNFNKSSTPSPYDAMIVEMQIEINKCKETVGSDTFKHAEIKFECKKMNEAKVRANGVNCPIGNDKKSKIYKAMDDCCDESKVTCEDKFKSVFPEITSVEQSSSAKEGYRDSGVSK